VWYISVTRKVLIRKSVVKKIKVRKKVRYSSSSFAVSFCLNENHIDNPIATNPITNNTSVTAIPKSTNNYPTMCVGVLI